MTWKEWLYKCITQRSNSRDGPLPRPCASKNNGKLVATYPKQLSSISRDHAPTIDNLLQELVTDNMAVIFIYTLEADQIDQ